MTFLDYGHVAYAYEHTRLQVSDRILHTDKTSSYMLYAMRTASVKKVRAMQHGITDGMSCFCYFFALYILRGKKKIKKKKKKKSQLTVNFWGSIMRCWTLKRAQHGNQNSLDSLVVWRFFCY